MTTKYNLPNIIFLDGVPSKHLGGISQTLYNLFDSYPSEKLFCLVEEKQWDEIDFNSLSCTKISIKDNLLKQSRRRYISKLNPLIRTLNAIYRDLFGFSIEYKKLPDSGLLLVCTTGTEKLHVAQLLHKKYHLQLLTYFMDDWTNGLKFNWVSGNINKITRYTLEKAVGRLMISEMLNESLINRYQLSPKPTYVVHNPVEINQDFDIPADITKVKTIKIIYAGSIWGMHLDALLMVAKAVEILNTEQPNSFKLCIYSKQMFWDMHQDKLQRDGVNYLGFINYDQLHEKLMAGHLLLVTSSFEKEYEPFSRSSVQTKITDYMKEGKPVLSVGPEYGACNWFVKKWKVGYVWDNLDINSLVRFLQVTITDNNRYANYAENAYNIVKEHFTKEVVQKELIKFILSLRKEPS